MTDHRDQGTSAGGAQVRAAAERWSVAPEAPGREDLERDLASIRAPLEEATTLPGRFYHDPAIHREELRRIFASMWLCVGREEDLAKPGDYLTRDVGAESVLVVRGTDGAINAF